MKNESQKGYWLNRNVIGFGLASLFGDLGYEMINAALPSFLTGMVGYQMAPRLLGFISGISDSAASILKLFSGIISDRLTKKKPIIALGYSLTTVFNGLVGFATSGALIIALRACSLVGKGLRDPARDALLAQSVDKQFYGRMFGFHRAMDSIGAILGPLVALFALWITTARSLFFLAIIPGAASVLSVMLLTKEEPKPTASNKNSFKNTTISLQELPPHFLYLVGILFFFNIGFFNKSFFILRAQQVLSATYHQTTSVSLSVLLYIFFNVIRATSEYFIGRLSDAIGRSLLLAITGFLFFGIASALMVAAPSSFWWYALIFIIAGISSATVGALARARAADLLPPAIRGTGYGLLQMTEGLGNLCSSIIVGMLWSWVNPEAGFIFSCVISFSATLLIIYYHKQSKRMPYGIEKNHVS